MEFIDAFLLASGVSYIVVAFLPRPVIVMHKDLKAQKKTEVIFFLLLATLILYNLLILDEYALWVILGLFYVCAALVSYLGYVEWMPVIMTDTYSMQIAMWAWDLAIAVCCFMKVTF